MWWSLHVFIFCCAMQDEGDSPRGPRAPTRELSSPALNALSRHASPAPVVRPAASPSPRGRDIGTSTPRGRDAGSSTPQARGRTPVGRSPTPTGTPKALSRPTSRSPRRSMDRGEGELGRVQTSAPPGTTSEYPYTWEDMTNYGFAGAGSFTSLIYIVLIPFFVSKRSQTWKPRSCFNVLM